MKDRITVIHVSNKNYGRIVNGKKSKIYKNLIEIWTDLFCELFEIEVNDDFQLIKNDTMIDMTEPVWIKIRSGYSQERYPIETKAKVSLSVGYGDEKQFSNPDILYYVLDILELKEAE